MFSTLDHQMSLKRLEKLDLLRASVAKRLVFSKLRCSIVVRNPYDRVISFYKDKFLRAEDYRLWMKDQGMEMRWQQSTQLFFPFLNLHTKMDPIEVSEKLSRVSFNEFMEILPKVYLQDGHLTPQYLASSLSFRLLGYRISFRLPMQIERIYKMESEKDMQALARDLQLDLETKINTTENLKTSVTWTPSNAAIVEKLYARDFEQFAYSRGGR